MRRFRLSQIIQLGGRIAAQVIFGGQPPLVGTIIVTDACNLTCAHCAVHNVAGVMYSYDSIVADMKAMYAEGIRILFLCGGETTIWYDCDRTLTDLIDEAVATGFASVAVVTNGTKTLDLPNTSLVLLSLDGLRDSHDLIRGQGVFDTIMTNLELAGDTNVCVYAAINNVNHGDVGGLCRLAHNHPNIRSISFNLHTPYPGTEHLALTEDEKRQVATAILEAKHAGMPVFNLDVSLQRYLDGNWKRPCRQCIVLEGGRRWDCGRCIDVPGLCENCGYLFAIEFQQLFAGNIPAIWDALKTYRRYV